MLIYVGVDVATPISTLSHHSDYVNCVTTGMDSSPCLAASAGNDQKIALWDLEKLVPTMTLERSMCNVLHLSCSII